MSAAALTISRSQWLEHQHTIYDLYVTQGLELKAIRQQLIDNHSFSARYTRDQIGLQSIH
jgi:hypothetical protein